MIVEVCVESVDSAVAAQRGGADRIELCCSLSEGGITPSAGLIRQVRSALEIPICVIIRPRGGDFVYNDSEFQVMREDVLIAKSLGCDGVVLGVLTAEDEVDQKRTRELIELSRPMMVTFHRAFDVVSDLDSALEAVIACGADRILSSGGRINALAGASYLKKIRQAAGSRIVIMAGAGVRISNVRSLVEASGVDEVHTSLRSVDGITEDSMVSGDRMGVQGRAWQTIREEDVRSFRKELLPLQTALVEELSTPS
jgi:copper homeostasis protein